MYSVYIVCAVVSMTRLYDLLDAARSLTDTVTVLMPAPFASTWFQRLCMMLADGVQFRGDTSLQMGC